MLTNICQHFYLQPIVIHATEFSFTGSRFTENIDYSIADHLRPPQMLAEKKRWYIKRRVLYNSL